MKERMKNPIFILALSGLIYQLLRSMNVDMELGLYQQWVDIISYLVIGVGVYSTFPPKDGGEK